MNRDRLQLRSCALLPVTGDQKGLGYLPSGHSLNDPKSLYRGASDTSGAGFHPETESIACIQADIRIAHALDSMVADRG